MAIIIFFFSSRRRHTRLQGDWSSDVCSSDLPEVSALPNSRFAHGLHPGESGTGPHRTVHAPTGWHLDVARLPGSGRRTEDRFHRRRDPAAAEFTISSTSRRLLTEPRADAYGAVQFVHDFEDATLEIGVGRVRLQPLADFAGRGGGLLAADEGVRPGEHQEDLAVALDLGQGSEGRLQAGKREGRLVPIVKRALARSPGPARRLPG